MGAQGVRQRPLPWFLLLAGLGWVVPAPPAHAAELVVRVDDGSGHPVADAVVMVSPRGSARKDAAEAPVRRIIDQKALAFIPYLEVFRPGDEVVFRNSDRTRHHVYSFSPVKAFEFVLAPRESSSPLQLDKLGAVAVGCNIHDGMIAYLYITDARWFAHSDASGEVRFRRLAPGAYDVRVWQPRLRPDRTEPRQTVGLEGQDSRTLRFALSLLPDPRLHHRREQMHY